MERLNCFVTIIILNRWVNPSSFSLNWFSWIQIFLEEGFAVEQLNLPYTFVTDPLSVHSRYGIAVIVIGCHDFRSNFCEEKDFAPNFYRCMQRAKWKGLFVVCKYLLGLFLLFDGSQCYGSGISFWNRCLSFFCRSETFFNIDFIWYSEFITLPNTCSYLWCVLPYCFVSE